MDADERIHVVGKGITRFHAVYWPAFLLSAGEPAPTRIHVHPYLTIDGAKLSKSSGAGVSPTELTKRYGQDALRWWITSDVNATSDTDFTVDRLVTKANETLANGLGNAVNRVTTLRHRHQHPAGRHCSNSHRRARPRASCRPTSPLPSPTSTDAVPPSLIADALAGLNQRIESDKPWKLARPTWTRSNSSPNSSTATWRPFATSLAHSTPSRQHCPGSPSINSTPILRTHPTWCSHVSTPRTGSVGSRSATMPASSAVATSAPSADPDRSNVVNLDDIAGRTAFITGGAQGIGLGIARALAAAGAKVAIADIDGDALDVAEHELAAADHGDGRHVGRARPRRLRDVADQVEAELGPVSLLFNNAGVAGSTPAGNMSYETWDWVIGINLHGVYNGIQTFVPRMIERGDGGYIVNTASGAGLVHASSGFLYATSKFGVVGLSEALHDELSGYHIGVSVLCPGPVATDIVNNTAKPAPGRRRPVGRGQRTRWRGPTSGWPREPRRTSSARWSSTPSPPSASTSSPTR